MSVPALRFKDESGLDFPEWEGKLLGEIATFSKGKGISKADIDSNGATYCIRYGELYTEYGETIHKIKSKTNVDVKSLKLSEVNDVIIPASGETQIDIATASCVQVSGVALGGDLNIIKSLVNGVFLSYYLNSQKKLDIAKLAQGNSVVHLYSSQLKLLDLNLPAKTEQTKIANFLTAIDEKISHLIQKHDLLTQYKKGVMQQIFSQELRFKDEDGWDFTEWEEDSLGNVCDVRDGTHESPKYYPKGIPLVTSKNLLENGEIDLADVNLITEIDFLSINKRSKVDTGDILFGMIGTIGNPVIVKTNNFAIKNVALIKQKEKLQNIFLVHYLKSNIVLRQFVNVTVGNTQKFIALGKFRELSIQIPSLKEQSKIANFLTAIDDKIAATQTQLQAVKQYKQGLLQQMFV